MKPLWSKAFSTIVSLACALVILQLVGRAATLPTGFSETLVAGGLTNPTAMSFAPDGRLFVCLQGGQLRVIKNGALLPTPFVTVTVDQTGERGLLGIAFDPAFATNGYLYVYYTATSPAVHNRVSRFTAKGDVAVGGSETILLELDNLGATNHNGGAIHFGPDGKLYVAVGENANSSNSQTLANPLGKMLRINADGSIPTNNPFYAQTSGNSRAIWALGLRNPFTFDFHSNGRMFINDVGQSTWEEVDEGAAGANYGWPTTEGPTTDPRFVSPLYAYQHSSGTPTGCAITGGAFYDPPAPQFPSQYYGNYFFADYCAGWIYRLDLTGPSPVAFAFASGISSPVDLQLGPDASLYYLARGSGGTVSRIEYSTSQAPTIAQQPQSQTAAVGQQVTFSVTASGATPLSYQWQRNGSNIAKANSSTYTTAPVTTSDNGARFRCIVTNSAGSATSNDATLTVATGTNGAPTPTITQPPEGTRYSGGDTITYAGTGSDPEDGQLGSSAFTWQVDFHHDTHIHPFIPATSGSTGGSFVIPTTGETSANVWYRILLTVTDSQGAATTTFRDVLPRTAMVTLATQPTGLQLTLDGQPMTAPLTFTGVVGIQRTIGAPSPQAGKSGTYTFGSWSDGGAATHTITTPPTTTTYTATYQGSQTGPAPPSNLVATAGTQTVGLSWTAPSGATSYNVLRTTSSKGTYAVVASGVTATSYNDTGLTSGVTYYYVVQAVSSGGTSGNSNQASATPN